MPFCRPPIQFRSLEDEYQAGSHSLGGDGNFNAGVFVEWRRSDGRELVEKRMKPSEIANGSAEFEMFIQRELKHKNVIEYVDAFIINYGQSLKASLYMEYYEHRTLEDYLQRLQSGQRARIGNTVKRPRTGPTLG